MRAWAERVRHWRDYQLAVVVQNARQKERRSIMEQGLTLRADLIPLLALTSA